MVNKGESIMKNGRTNQGITLVALVITIIVLLILAGVTIAMLIGENGILNQANQAKTENEIKAVEEKARLLVNYARSLDETAKLTKENLENAIDMKDLV